MLITVIFLIFLILTLEGKFYCISLCVIRRLLVWFEMRNPNEVDTWSLVK